MIPYASLNLIISKVKMKSKFSADVKHHRACEVNRAVTVYAS